MKEFPEGWIETNLGAICGSGQYGWTTKAADQGTIKYLRTTDITKGRIDWQRVPFCGELPVELDKYRIQENDILISRAGSVGFSALIDDVPVPTVFASYLIRFIPSKDVEPRYISHYLKSPVYWQQISEASAGIALANVNAKKLAELQVPLAPLAEQKRIADKLDTLLARVDACGARLDRVQLILKRFRQSVLAAATSGQLTEDWREENHIRSNNWPTTNLRTVADLRLGKMLDKTKNVGMPTRYIRNINVRWFTFDLSDVALMRATEPDKKELAIKDGDLLVCEGGEPGRCSVWNLGDTDLVFQKAIHRVRCGEDVSAKWVAINLKHDADSGKLDSYFTGTTIKHLTRKALATYEILVPSAGEQQEIIRRVETLFAFADRLEARLEVAQSRVERLTPATLAKAFRGELVPQDPNDEPASELLRRVKLENKKQCRTRFS